MVSDDGTSVVPCVLVPTDSHLILDVDYLRQSPSLVHLFPWTSHFRTTSGHSIYKNTSFYIVCFSSFTYQNQLSPVDGSLRTKTPILLLVYCSMGWNIAKIQVIVSFIK